jgi:acyl-CoA thioester hydrolase
MYSRSFVAGWGDMDSNSHMRNTAFLDRAADVRMMFFAEHGFPVQEFVSRRLGPVVMKDEIEYFREVGLLHEITVTLAIAGLAGDGSRFLMRNDILNASGRLCARVTSAGGWLDLGARKLVAPPPPLLSALAALTRTENFVELPSSVKQTS